MKKVIVFIVIILILIGAILYSTYYKDFLSLLDEKKVYKIENINYTDINTLEEYMFFDKGILSYNNQKIVYTDFNNKVLWESENFEFSNRVFTAGDYIIKQTDKNILVADKNNRQFVLAEINGNIINVSRENGMTAFIVKEKKQALFIMNDNNEVIVDGKEFEDIITGISFSDKSQTYSITTLTFDNGIPVNTLYFNSLDDVELWSAKIENEIIINTKVINNNVIAIGTGSIYYYNNNGKLMWKNNVYNKILDCEISSENQRIYILLDKDKSDELISYNFDGRVMEIQEAPSIAASLMLVGNRVLVYDNNTIYLLHSKKADKLYEDTENFKDIYIEGNNMYILFKNKIVKGKLK